MAHGNKNGSWKKESHMNSGDSSQRKCEVIWRWNRKAGSEGVMIPGGSISIRWSYAPENRGKKALVQQAQ